MSSLRRSNNLLRCKSDEDLMERWIASRRRGSGEAAAFDVLWERHHKLVFRSVRRVLGAHRALIEEAVQDAWVEVVRATHYRPGSFRSFLRGIATRQPMIWRIPRATAFRESLHA